jgi:3-dehydroquinate synthase
MAVIPWSDSLSVHARHRVWWVEDLLHDAASAWHEALAGLEGSCVAFVDSGVANAWPEVAERLHACVRDSGATGARLSAVETMPGGERCKDGTAEAMRVAQACFDHGVSRRGAVIAVGGGAVLDAVGFGAAMAHRGVPVIRVPTTTLAQDDSAMGVKCGVNAFGQKNALGAFGVPHAVLCCRRLLGSLPAEHWIGGFSEAVKISLLKDPGLLDRIERDAKRIIDRDMTASWPIVRRSAELHRGHIVQAGDPFELGSGRPLDHGHWVAHRLESLTAWALPHGQAVAVGLAVDACVACEMGWLATHKRDRIIGTLRSLGLPVFHAMLLPVERLLAGLAQFRQHLGGQLAVPLLRDMGHAQDASDIPSEAVGAAVGWLAQHAKV